MGLQVLLLSARSPGVPHSLEAGADREDLPYAATVPGQAQYPMLLLTQAPAELEQEQP